MTPILFLRHGPTEWNAIGRVQGHTDVPLSDEGRAAVGRWQLDAEFLEFEWVASPLSRAQETARLLGVADCASEPRLAEANWGDWEGRILEELRAELGEELARNEARGLDLAPPGGESPRDVCNRLAAWLKELAPRSRPTVAVAHAGVLRAAYTLATGWDMSRASPLERGHGWAHLYDLAPDGRLTVRALNIPLEVDDG
jgi:broad specificity phosphatase PhoE